MKPSLNTEQLIETMNARYAVKKFDSSKKIETSTWQAIAESMRLAPSSYGLQPWKFLLVENSETRKTLQGHSWNQTQVTEASHFIVLTYKVKMDEDHIQKFVESTAETRGVPVESLQGYKEMMMGDLVNGPRSQVISTWAQKQCYIAMGQMMLAAAALGVDSCPMEGLDPAAYDKVLNLENTGFATVAAVAFGYRHADDKYQFAKKSRFPMDQILQKI